MPMLANRLPINKNKNMNWLLRRLRVFVAMALLLVVGAPLSVKAATSGPQLVQVKVTSSSQFVTIYNNSDAASSSSYQLTYYNNYDRSKATSSKVYSLNSALPANGYYIFNDGPLDLCQQSIVDSVSLGFSTTSGMLELVRLDNGNSTAVSSVKWASKSPPDGVQLLPTAPSGYQAFLQYSLSESTWGPVQSSLSSPCNIQKVITSTAAPTLPSGQAPSVSIQTAADASSARNKGLKAPVVNELLPNPKSPLTDSDDEFIELYNPNDSVFSLDGYQLEVGTTTKRTYSFKDEDNLPAKTYVAFMSSVTGLSLSNSGSQVSLKDASGAILSQSAVYGTAEEGQVWSLVNGSWKWLLTPTPNAANNGVSADPTTSSTTINEDATATAVTTKAGSTNSTQKPAEELEDTLPLHPTILAGIGLSAVGYGIYEYRRDIANRFLQFRRYFRFRGEARSKVSGE